MSANRAGVFDDLSDFAPATPSAGAPPEKVKAVAEGAAFRSREPRPAPAPPEPPLAASPVRREPRRYRTGRNVQLNLKVRQEAADAFYALADRTGMVLGEAFERAVQALQREMSSADPKAPE